MSIGDLDIRGPRWLTPRQIYGLSCLVSAGIAFMVGFWLLSPGQ